MYVITPDPDNERGVRVVDHESGEVIATGHLVCDAQAIEPSSTVACAVHFEGQGVTR